jgi:hypothetical protein
MGYIIAIVLLLIAVPLVFLLMSRAPRGAGGMGRRRHDTGVTVTQPSSDQPTPPAHAMNRPSEGADKNVPPG